jgi:hypothetical protein
MTKDEALDLALEALGYLTKPMAKGWDAETQMHKRDAAITAIKQVLAKDALYKLAEESCTSGLRLDDWDKIGCVNHDCDKCKAVQEPVAWGNLANWCLDSDRVLITDKTEAEKYHRDVYDLTPLYTTPPVAPVQQKPLFADIIAKHPGLAEELKAMDEAFELGYKAGLAAAHPAPVQSAEREEPVAWIFKPNRELLWPNEVERKNPLELNEYAPLYTTPPAAQQQWVGLTLTDREKLRDQFEDWSYPAILVDAVADILKEKNT